MEIFRLEPNCLPSCQARRLEDTQRETECLCLCLIVETVFYHSVLVSTGNVLIMSSCDSEESAFCEAETDVSR